MSVEDHFRGLRDDDRWIGVPPSDRGRAGRAATASARGALRPWRVVLVSAAVAVVVAVVSIVAIQATPTPPAATATVPQISSTAPTTASPHPTGTTTAGPLTGVACGATVPPSSVGNGQTSLADGRGGADLRIANYAAAGTGGTTVSVRLSGDTTDGQTGASYSGQLHVALLRDDVVVADAVGGPLRGRVGFNATVLASVGLSSTSCSTGQPLPDGTYSVIAFGPAVTVGGFGLRPSDIERTVQLRGGVLVGGIRTAANGPWHGTGSPTCGTTVDTAAINASAASSLAALDRAGLHIRITGIGPDATGLGRVFIVTVTNSSTRAVRIITTGDSTTTLIKDDTIVSAPDSENSEPSPSTRTIAPGRSVQLTADAPVTGCELSADGTETGPQLGAGPHFAYIDLCTHTSDGDPLVLTATYTSDGLKRTILSQ